jgi:hypothetical protein
MAKVSKDMSVTFVGSLLRRDYNLVREPAMQAWVSKNGALVALINSLSPA